VKTEEHSVFTQCSVCFAQCCLCLLVISYWLALRFSHNVLSVVPSVACVSWLSVIDWLFGFHTMFCLLCSVLPLSLGYHFLICSSVFTQCSVCFAQCCLCLRAQQTEHCVKTEEPIKKWKSRDTGNTGHNRQNIVWKLKGQSITDNQETQATLGTTDKTLCENRRANQ
jgi:hypothetical protein